MYRKECNMPHKRLHDWLNDVKHVMTKNSISVEELACKLNLTTNYIVSMATGGLFVQEVISVKY